MLPFFRPVPTAKSVKPILIALVVMLSPDTICSFRVIVRPRLLNNTVLGAGLTNRLPSKVSKPNREPPSTSPSIVVVPVKPPALAVDIDWMVVALRLSSESNGSDPMLNRRLFTVAVACAPVAVPVEFEVRTAVLKFSKTGTAPPVKAMF